MNRRTSLSRLGYASYSDYLKSKHWLRLRAEYRRTQKMICVCGETRNLHLHHKTYERLGAERMDDLQPLCQACHTMAHQLVDEGVIGIDLVGFFDARRAVLNRIEKKPERRHTPRRGAVGSNYPRKVIKAKPKLTPEQRFALKLAIEEARAAQEESPSQS